MSKRILAAVLGLGAAACIAAPAQARLDHSRIDNGPVSSLYENDGRQLSKPQRDRKDRAAMKRGTSKTAKARAGKYAKSRGEGRRTVARATPNLSDRAVTASRSADGGGGTSRGCLQPEARALLGRIESQFGPVQIISTCRPGAVIAGSGKPSKHRYGLAIDFDAGGRKGAIVNWLIANHHSGGTMTYANMSHIHVDIGQHFVSLGSGGGRNRRG